MSETAIVATLGFIGILLSPILQELVIHRRRRRHRLIAQRRGPYTAWLKAMRGLIDVAVNVQEHKDFEDATYRAVLYASPDTADALWAALERTGRIMDSISDDPAEADSESWQAAIRGVLIEHRDKIRALMMTDVSE